jgi:two-component system, NarL family, response regulator DesR
VTIASQPITLALAQFEDIVSRGLQSLIDEDPNLRLVAADLGRERLSCTLSEQRPDVAILNFGSLANPAELRSLRADCPDTRFLVLADNPSPAECRQVISFGATGCLARSAEARDILHAIYLASRGLHVLPPAGPSSYEPAGPTPLTPREADVLELLQSGHSNAEIAGALHVSTETVRTHARHIYRKLGVSTRRELRQST